MLYGDPQSTSKEIEKLSVKDARAYLRFHEKATKFAEAIKPLILVTPPSLTEMVSVISGEEFDEIIRDFLLMGSAQLVNELFESEELKTVLCQESVGNTAMSPSEVGTGYLLALAEASGGNTYAIGGSGAASFSLASAARKYGTTIMTDTLVQEILVTDGKVTGVRLGDGRKINSPVVVSNADPKTTILKLMNPDAFEEEFLDKVRRLRNDGGQTKINVALTGRPTFKREELNPPNPRLYSNVNFCESVADLEKAFYQSKFGDIPEVPPVYNFIQTLWDDSVAPPGHHTVSTILRYTPYKLNRGSWEDRVNELQEKYISIWDQYAIFRPLVEHIEVLSPWHNEVLLNIDQGHVSHLEQVLYQMLSFRPILGHSDYRMPIAGLYLCGAGTHPGGGVSGAAGHNAATIVMEDFEKGFLSRKKEE